MDRFVATAVRDCRALAQRPQVSKGSTLRQLDVPIGSVPKMPNFNSAGRATRLHVRTEAPLDRNWRSKRQVSQVRLRRGGTPKAGKALSLSANYLPESSSTPRRLFKPRLAQWFVQKPQKWLKATYIITWCFRHESKCQEKNILFTLPLYELLLLLTYKLNVVHRSLIFATIRSHDRSCE